MRQVPDVSSEMPTQIIVRVNMEARYLTVSAPLGLFSGYVM